MASFLQKLQPKSALTIGVSVCQSGMLEVCVFDKATQTIKKYANRNIKYNHQTREITDFEEFKSNILAMYQELDIPNNCNVVLSLPSVFFDLTSVPLILDNYAIESVLLGEVEQSYIFKKTEPEISWIEQEQNERTDNKTLVFAALQKNIAEGFVDAFKEIGSKLVAIDNSYNNLINTIPKTEFIQDEIRLDAPWNIVLVTHNSFVIFSMLGKKLVEFYEEPIALRSISKDELYTTLSESLNTTLQNYIANSMLLISDSSEVDANILSEKLEFMGRKNVLNQNIFASGQIIETSANVLPDYISNITLYALGSASYTSVEDTKKLNLLPKDSLSLGGKTYSVTIAGVDLDLTTETIKIFTGLAITSLVIIFGLCFLLINFTNKSMENRITQIEADTQTCTEEIERLDAELNGDKKAFDISAVKEEIVKNNKQTILYYNLLSFNIPPSTWITHFFTNSKGGILIEGKTVSTNNVYLFFKGIKASVENSNLALTKLKYAKGFEEMAPFTTKLVYEFELANSQYTSSSDNSQGGGETANEGENGENLDKAKDKIQKKVDKETKSSTPDLPPIEDIQPDSGSKSGSEPDLPDLPN